MLCQNISYLCFKFKPSFEVKRHNSTITIRSNNVTNCRNKNYINKLAEATRWESAGEGDYTIENVEKSTRGTEIVLHLKEGESEFLDGWKLRSIVRKFSDHISLPIVMDKEIQSEFGGDDEDENAEKAAPEIVEETINSAAALWTKSRQ